MESVHTHTGGGHVDGRAAFTQKLAPIDPSSKRKSPRRARPILGRPARASRLSPAFAIEDWQARGRVRLQPVGRGGGATQPDLQALLQRRKVPFTRSGSSRHPVTAAPRPERGGGAAEVDSLSGGGAFRFPSPCPHREARVDRSSGASLHQRAGVWSVYTHGEGNVV